MRPLIDKLNQWFQILVLITIPIEPIKINNICIILWVITVMLSPNKDRLRKYSLWIITPFFIYFLMLIMGVLISPDPISRASLTFLENKIPFAVLPFLLLLSQPVDRAKAINFFIGIVCLLCLICLTAAVAKNIQYNQFHNLNPLLINPWFYTYGLYADGAGLHPTYFSIFILFGLTSILGWKSDRPLSYLGFTAALFLGINLLFLMSRQIVALAFLYYVFYLSFGLQVSLAKKLKYFVAGIFVVIFALINPIVQTRLNDIVENNESTFSGVNMKFQIWGALYSDIISKNFVIGIGAVNQDLHIREVYKNHGIMEAYEHNYNSHNQYIESLVHQGLVGFIILLFLFSFYLKVGFKQRDFLMVAIIVIFAFSSLTESLFLRQKGITFFCFIVPFLALNLAMRKKMNILKY